MICDFYENERARNRRISRSYGKGKSLFVIENVPVITCPHCGESYMSAETAHEIDRIEADRKRTAPKREVAVARFE